MWKKLWFFVIWWVVIMKYDILHFSAPTVSPLGVKKKKLFDTFFPLSLSQLISLIGSHLNFSYLHFPLHLHRVWQSEYNKILFNYVKIRVWRFKKKIVHFTHLMWMHSLTFNRAINKYVIARAQYHKKISFMAL